MTDTQKQSGPKSPRPQSMMAQNFAMDLDSVFGLGDGEGAAKLQENLEEKKKAVSTQNAELEALQARLRAMEERLEDIKPGAVARKPAHLKSQEENKSKKKVEEENEDSDEDGEDTEEEDEEEEQDESSDDTSAEENPKRRK